MKDLMKGLVNGVKHNPWGLPQHGFFAFSVIFTVVKGVTHFIPGLDFTGSPLLTVIIIICLLYAAYRVRELPRIAFVIKHTDTNLTILFGDLFAQDGCRTIAVNEFFDSKLGRPVSEKSVHGIFLKKCFGASVESFDKIIDQELQGLPFTEVQRSEGKFKKFAIGTTAEIKVDQQCYLCFALTHTDEATFKAHADVPTLWRGLEGLWRKARVCLGGTDLVLPLGRKWTGRNGIACSRIA